MWYVVIFAVTLLLDQITKILTDGIAGTHVFIPGVINFMSVYNEGASFSILSDKPWAQNFFLILTAAVLLCGIIYVIFSKKKSKWLWVSVSLLFSGAIGNFIDRIAFKYVRDFISFAFFNFPTFNVADSCLCIGVAMLVIYLLFMDEDGLFSDSSSDKKAEKTKACAEQRKNPCENSQDLIQNLSGEQNRGLRAKSLKINAAPPKNDFACADDLNNLNTSEAKNLENEIKNE